MADHPLAARLGDFRKMAAEARRDAERATSTDMRLGYEQLISEIEAAMASGPSIVGPQR
jgi:hypothetical protein